MSAVAFRHPEVEETLASPEFEALAAPTMEWSDTAQYRDLFINANPELDRAQRRRLEQRHKNFILSPSVVICATLLLVQVIAFMSLKASELKVMRATSKVDAEIALTRRQISLKQTQLATYNSLPRLSAWAEQMHYHKATLPEMDDVTSRAPLPAASASDQAPKAEAPKAEAPKAEAPKAEAPKDHAR